MAEQLLSTYFNLLSTVTCEKAKDLVEKKKNNVLPPTLQICLAQFAQCEKNYFSLIFLEQKWFGRRDPLKHTYSTLSIDLQSVQKQVAKENASQDGNSSLFNLISEELSNYCSCRIDCIELYEQCLHKSPLKDLEKSISELLDRYSTKFQHSLLQPIRDSFQSEFETFRRLVSTSSKISKGIFFASLIELHKIHQTLAVWQPLLAKDHHQHSFRRGFFGFGEKHATSSPSALYQWMNKYFQSLVSKFSFYFYETLNQQSQGDEIKMILPKTSYDYITKCQSFCKKMDSSVLLVTNFSTTSTANSDDSSKPNLSKLLQLPAEISDDLWLNIDTFLLKKADDISAEKIAFWHERQMEHSYYAAQVDPELTLVVVILGRKNEKDTYVQNFIGEIIGHTKSKRIFSLLRPGSK